jgi:hypothetical protein
MCRPGACVTEKEGKTHGPLNLNSIDYDEFDNEMIGKYNQLY